MIRLALLGDPVAHSRSPAMHRAALAAGGLEGSYEARRVDLEGMASAAAEMRTGVLQGANITMPHKLVARTLADTVSPGAARAGSVNTWVRESGALIGYSTDIDGIRGVWEKRGLAAGAVLILGSGGAAAASLVALEGERLFISARRRDAAESLVGRTGVEAEFVEWGVAVAGAVVVNATPLGMRGEKLPDPVMETATGLLEMAYGSGETPAARSVRSAGLPLADGLDLLVAQAEESFRLWTGEYPVPGVMDAAARKNSRHLGDGPNQS